ncbi:MAG: SLC13 family permease [Oscillospiraceae bacterium]
MEKDRTKRNILLFFLAAGICLLVCAMKVPRSIAVVNGVELTREAQLSLGVLAFALILWMTEAVPFHITGLMSMVLLAVLNVGSFKDIVREGFGNDTIVFFIGVLVLSAFITLSGLGKRISMFILSLTGNDTSKIIFGFIVVGAVVSMWVTDMAVSAMLMPIAVAILEREGLKPMKSNFGKALLIACAWGPIVGGIATPAGSSPNPISIALLKDMADTEITFIDWMKYGVPSAIILIIPSWFILTRVFKPEISHLSCSKTALKEEYKALGKMNREELFTLVIFALTVILWLITPYLEDLLGISIPIAMPAILAATLFFLPGVSRIKWKTIENDVSWSSILLVVSGMSLGMMLYKSGAAEWLSVAMLGNLTTMPALLQIIIIILITSLLKIVFASNAVTATVLIPIIIQLSQRAGLPPLILTLPAAITSSLCYILVTSSPTNVIPYSAGYFSIKDFAKAGVIMSIVSTILVSLTIYGIGLLTKLY